MQPSAAAKTGDAQRLSFKEMCSRFEVTPRTLRYYEAIELLFPEREGSARFYSARDIARMTLILRGRRFGFALEGNSPMAFDLRRERESGADGGLGQFGNSTIRLT